jgi:hypothetical protein
MDGHEEEVVLRERPSAAQKVLESGAPRRRFEQLVPDIKPEAFVVHQHRIIQPDADVPEEGVPDGRRPEVVVRRLRNAGKPEFEGDGSQHVTLERDVDGDALTQHKPPREHFLHGFEGEAGWSFEN